MTAGANDASFLAPQARLYDPATDQPLAATAQSDLISVQVTQVNTGPAQLSVTINNQREGGDVKPVGTSPSFPPWKYNDLSQFKPGQRIGIAFRYGGKASGWQTMIVARVTGMAFSFPSGGGAQLTLQGEDLLSLLKNFDEKDANYPKQTEEKIALSIVERSGCGLTAVVKQPAGVSQPLRSLLHTKKTPYLQFLQGLADRLDFEIWVDAAGTELHFEPARSLADPGAAPLVLHWGGVYQGDGANLTDFNAKIQVADQYNEVKAGGGNPDNQGQISSVAASEEIKKDLHGKDALDAATVRSKFFLSEKGEKPARMSVDTSNLDEARAKLKAAAELRKKARGLLTVEGTAVGHLQLRAGIHVQVSGMRAPFDGIYYVTKAVHSLDSGGYKTQFSLRRPGITDPTLYLKAS